MSRPALKVLNGSRDVADTLRHYLSLAEKGELDGFVIATIAGNELSGGWAIIDDTPFAFARLVASLASMQHGLQENGLEPE